MKALLLAGAVGASTVLAAAVPGAPPVGGACAYRPFEGSCSLDEVTAVPAGSNVIVRARYRLPIESPMRLRWEKTVPAPEAAAWKRHLASNRTLPCRGQTLVSGTCTPVMGQVQVPGLPSKK